jgi:MFS superfamily sulfate permease-like transporter
MFAGKHGYRLDATQEFLAIGAANLTAGLGRGLPISGGMSQSLVNETGGARTPLSGLIAALVTLVVVLFFTGLLRTLPQPVLAAVVLMAVTGLIQIDALRHIWRFSKVEFAVAMAALMGVLAAGLLQGVLIGVIISILLLIRRASRPRVVEVARVPGTSFFADVTRHPENQREPGVLVVRPEGSLVYFNVDHVRDALSAMVRGQAESPRLIVLFMGNVPHVDLAGAELIVHLRDTFVKRGIDFRLAETRGEVREALRRFSSPHAARLAEANQTVDTILSQWRADRP